MFRLFNRSRPRRVLVIGLDCAAPHLIFDQFRADLPNLSRLMDGGSYGILESCIPCITVPAWASMLSSRDPGVLGVYGFRNRADNGYGEMAVANGADIKTNRVWDYVSDAGRESVVLAVPQTYPPRPLNGHLVSGFPVPGNPVDAAFTYPAIFKQEVLNAVPDYAFDVRDFRTEDKSGLHQRLLDFTESQYQLVEHTLTHKSWDFFIHVNIGVDRMHHAFWRFHDPMHRLYTPGNPLEHSIREYYRLVDEKIGRMVERVDDNTVILVVSDHGVKRMDGGVCLNEWLWKNGWLAFKTPPADGQITKFDEANVDWSRTRAWGSGGYYGRVSLNVAGREPQGIIAADAYEAVRDELAEALKTIPGPDGTPIGAQSFKPQTIYNAVRGIAPDLLVYFGDLHWRSVGSLGHGAFFTLENDTGPDDANHDTDGLFIVYDPKSRSRGQIERRQLMDIAPTVLERMGIAIPAEMQGRLIG